MSDLAWTSPWPAIAGMALATLAVRWFGYWLMGRFAIGPRMRRALEALPGSLFIAFVLPLAMRAGWVGVAGAATAMALMALVGREIVALAGSLVVVVLLRAAGLP